MREGASRVEYGNAPLGAGIGYVYGVCYWSSYDVTEGSRVFRTTGIHNRLDSAVILSVNITAS